MRVLIINTSERVGGAAIAANRLMEALKKNGVKVKMLVRDKQTDHLTVLPVGHNWTQPFKFLWERFCIFAANCFSRTNLFRVDIANTGTDVTRFTEFQRADVIHLHWVNQGFLSLSNINKIIHAGKPVVITMHDQWHFTGICHYSGDCQKYKELCQHCELMKCTLFGDLAKQVFLKKERMYSDARLTFVGCSQWMADLAKTSKLTQGHRVISIPNAINVCLNTIWFHYLVEALQLIKQQNPNIAKSCELVVVGGAAENVRHLVPFNAIPISYVKDPQKMVQLYNAVDLYVTPSLQDNLPNTIMESMACGTPCVGFKVGGIPEMIDHKENGYVAAYKDAQDFANGILWTLAADHGALSRHARNKVMVTYSENAVARKYIDVYED